MLEDIFKEIDLKLKASYAVFSSDLSGIRSGSLSVSILDGIVVSTAMGKLRLNQVASLSVVNNKMLSVQVWDKGNVGAVKDAIISSDLGMNPIVEGTVLRLPVPDLTEERRKELVKVLRKYGDRAKVAVRNIRRDSIAKVKALEKNKEISEDEMHVCVKKIDKLISEEDTRIDGVVSKKEADILKV
ncbi:ribosome recycling factor [Neorickettsia helminthoeca str. Oregon]|uniref:Ribosome-recycling factor n=1 Tax=Neorickettsia helminthoeca str. Oregon TaxID=1286528 RepID=X5H5F6_9RICK|nr:ribosome recycling factor [Neorickettsia helminthoeca]AHX11821.1 ribosome recycling factor [Neorickettsia helminthoeca str. Oregon]